MSTDDTTESDNAESRQSLTGPTTTTERYVKGDWAEPFSDWHRNEVPDWYKFIDIDYIGFVPDYDAKGAVPYILIERIRITKADYNLDDAPGDYPIKTAKEMVYSALAEGLDVPAFTLWHTDACDEFLFENIETGERTKVAGHHGYCDFLDEHRIEKKEEVAADD